MVYNFIGLIYVIIAGIFRYRIKGDLSKNEEEKNKILEAPSSIASESEN